MRICYVVSVNGKDHQGLELSSNSLVVSIPGARVSPRYGRQGHRPRGHCGSHVSSRRYWNVRRRRRITLVVSMGHTLYFGLIHILSQSM